MAFATAAVTLLVLGSATGARAAITVANQNDSGPGSLRQAVAEAPPGETIVVPAGTYTLTSEPLKLLKSVTIAGHGSADTIVRSGGPFRVITILGPLDATIGGLTIRDGSGATSVVEGAGILSEKANLTLRDSVVTKNFANTDGAPGVNGGVALGGGFYVEGGTLSLIDSKVIGNAATGVGGSGKNGGVVEGAGVWTSKATVTVSNSTISGNLLDVRGGQGSSTPAQNGGVAEGGGLWVDGALSIANSAVNGNTATAVAGHGSNGGVVEGGGLWAVGPLRIMNSTISGNLVDARGGQGPADPGQNGGVVQGGGVWAVQSTSDPSSVAGSTIGDNVID